MLPSENSLVLPKLFHTSTGKLSGPVAFPFFMFLRATSISALVTYVISSSTCCSYFHLLFIPSLYWVIFIHQLLVVQGNRDWMENVSNPCVAEESVSNGYVDKSSCNMNFHVQTLTIRLTCWPTVLLSSRVTHGTKYSIENHHQRYES